MLFPTPACVRCINPSRHTPDAIPTIPAQSRPEPLPLKLRVLHAAQDLGGQSLVASVTHARILHTALGTSHYNSDYLMTLARKCVRKNGLQGAVRLEQHVDAPAMGQIGGAAIISTNSEGKQIRAVILCYAPGQPKSPKAKKFRLHLQTEATGDIIPLAPIILAEELDDSILELLSMDTPEVDNTPEI